MIYKSRPRVITAILTQTAFEKPLRLSLISRDMRDNVKKTKRQNSGKMHSTLPPPEDDTSGKSAGRQLTAVTENQMCTFNTVALSAEQARVSGKITHTVAALPSIKAHNECVRDRNEGLP